MNKHTLFQICAMLIVIALVTVSPCILGSSKSVQAAYGDRITISDRKFYAGGTRIWMNAANTPWDNWNDFGGSYDRAWWDDHFRQLRENGVNATRVWITCDGTVGINIDSSGYVSGATSAHWSHLDDFFQIAQSRQIYIMATLMSFDHFNNSKAYYQRWRNWINSDSNIDSYINNYLIPFLNRYKNNPYLWSIDLMNEPDWVYENAECGQIPWERLQVYFAKAAKAIHENSQVLVTVGMAMPKYQSGACSGCQGNKIADSALQAKVNDPDVYIDFYSSHTYSWQDPYWGIPFYMSPNSYYGTDLGKLVMIGETCALGSAGHTLTQDYENAYLNGWQGVMAWTSNGVDACGGFNNLSPATRAFRDNHYDLVFPGSTPPTSTPAQATLVIYDDSTTWENWSWSTTIDFNNVSPVYAGARSIAVTYTAGWAALSLRKSPAQSTSGYTAITFWAYGGSSGTRQISVYVQTTDSGGESTKINVDIPANQWTQFTISPVSYTHL
ncbi:MAG: cellulase family glycosylhydrolase, partial [Anaerolineae bacterium]|nr:cellulase family glycosylhydrolase [Anaerolineae bacterium]